ncbi:hypothetical protein Psta_0280 [Pirellula staleyi DSM 6068]|uniref:Uncharacterized protein n=1 Tax=Pirellula staleyi (strain ATCC 27377 / DSM 6068 / ICPB 4128) TaxID=530564 RepID=D2R1I9_PIRSD|nr:hypothetical protein Psta_0280 [Pirellula staleyi DSM 6068]
MGSYLAQPAARCGFSHCTSSICCLIRSVTGSSAVTFIAARSGAATNCARRFKAAVQHRCAELRSCPGTVSQRLYESTKAIHRIGILNAEGHCRNRSATEDGVTFAALGKVSLSVKPPSLDGHGLGCTFHVYLVCGFQLRYQPRRMAASCVATATAGSSNAQSAGPATSPASSYATNVTAISIRRSYTSPVHLSASKGSEMGSRACY